MIYVLDENTKPKFELFERVEAIFTGELEGVPVSVKKDFTVIGLRYCLHHGKIIEGVENYQAVGEFVYDLTEALGSTSITKKESELQKKVIKKSKKVQNSK